MGSRCLLGSQIVSGAMPIGSSRVLSDWLGCRTGVFCRSRRLARPHRPAAAFGSL